MDESSQEPDLLRELQKLTRQGMESGQRAGLQVQAERDQFSGPLLHLAHLAATTKTILLGKPQVRGQPVRFSIWQFKPTDFNKDFTYELQLIDW